MGKRDRGEGASAVALSSKAPRTDSDGPSFALRGVMDGVVLLNQGQGKRRCIVLGAFFPNWVFYLEAMGLELLGIGVRDERFISLVRLICPSGVPLSRVEEWSELLSIWPAYDAGVVCLLDGRVSRALLDVLETLGIEDIVSTQRSRGTFQGWNEVHLVVQHTSVGGVTIREPLVLRHTKGHVSGLPGPPAQALLRDASTVLSQALFARHFQAPPSPLLLNPLSCVNLGSPSNAIYHGYGWLPSGLDRRVRVLYPALNSGRHGGRWGLRVLTDSEILAGNDVPSSFASRLLTGGLEEDFFRHLLPGKCLMTGFRRLFHGGGDSIPAEPILPKAREAQSLMDLGTVPPKILKRSGLSLDRDQIPKDGKARKCDSSLEMEVGKVRAEFEDVAREKRERFAAKADDAEVPEYLWLEHLFEDASEPWDQSQREGMIRAAPLLRKVMLSWWTCSNLYFQMGLKRLSTKDKS